MSLAGCFRNPKINETQIKLLGELFKYIHEGQKTFHGGTHNPKEARMSTPLPPPPDPHFSGKSQRKFASVSESYGQLDTVPRARTTPPPALRTHLPHKHHAECRGSCSCTVTFTGQVQRKASGNGTAAGPHSVEPQGLLPGPFCRLISEHVVISDHPNTLGALVHVCRPQPSPL